MLKVGEGAQVVNVHALVASGVNGDGYREILGLQVTSAEDGAGWLGFFRDLTARGLTAVALVTSDAHAGLLSAIGALCPALVAAVPHALLRERDDGEAAILMAATGEGLLAVDTGAAALGRRPARRLGARPVSTRSSTP